MSTTCSHNEASPHVTLVPRVQPEDDEMEHSLDPFQGQRHTKKLVPNCGASDESLSVVGNYGLHKRPRERIFSLVTLATEQLIPPPRQSSFNDELPSA